MPHSKNEPNRETYLSTPSNTHYWYMLMVDRDGKSHESSRSGGERTEERKLL